MNKVYMHYEEKNQWYKIAILLCVIFFGIFGFYKNGFTYFLQGKMNLFESFYPLIYPLGGIICCILSNVIRYKKLVLNIDSIVEGVLIGLMIPSRMSFGFYFLLLVVYMIYRSFKIDQASFISRLLLFKVFSILICNLLLHIDYQNFIEIEHSYLYGTFDAFIGRSVGSVGTTSILLLIVYYCLNYTNYFYKKDLPIYILVTYSTLILGYDIWVGKSSLLLNLLNSHVYFMAIILATIPNTSPAEKKFLIPYGITIGTGCFIFQEFFSFVDGIYFVLLATQIIWFLYLYFRRKRYVKIEKNEGFIQKSMVK